MNDPVLRIPWPSTQPPPMEELAREEDPTSPFITREWLVTNGLGGYASGTVATFATRRYHGLLVAGRTIPEAWGQIYFLERACQAQVAALAGGCELVFPPEAVRQHTAGQFNQATNLEHAEMLWESCLRLIEDGRPDYRS